MPQPNLAHPFHLHGYAFHVMKMGSFRNVTTITDEHIDQVLREHNMMLKSGQYKHPPAKDTVSIPESGYLIFRFKADNPGTLRNFCIGIAKGLHNFIKHFFRLVVIPLPFFLPHLHRDEPHVPRWSAERSSTRTSKISDLWYLQTRNTVHGEGKMTKPKNFSKEDCTARWSLGLGYVNVI